MTRARALAAVLALAALLAGCGDDEPTIVADRSDGANPAATAAEWERLPDPPLPDRTRAVGVWTGDEVLVLGGDHFTCPPNASCAAPVDPPLRDGAALDLGTGTWRTVNEPPVGFHSAETAVVGGDVFLLAATDYQSGRSLLRYDIGADTWTTVDTPFIGDVAWYRLLAADDRLIAYPGSEETGVVGDHVLDPATGTWTPLAPDPLTPAFDRIMVWAAPHLYLFDKENVPQPGSEKPSVLRAARLDLGTDGGGWERLPDSEIIGGGAGWLVDGDRLINPLLGGADGGEVNGWGRTHANGGILDVATSTWTTLPGTDTATETERSAGAVNATSALYLGTGGEVLDADTDTWLTMPVLPDGLPLTTAGRSAIAMRDGGYWWWTP